MAKVKEDKSRVTLEVDGKQAINQLGKLEMEAKQLAIDLKMAKKGTQEYADANKKLKEAEAQIKAVRQQLGLTGMTMTQLSRYQRELRKEIQNTTTAGTERYRELRSELLRVNQVLQQQRQGLQGTTSFFGGLKGSIKELASSAGIMLGLAGAFEAIRKSFTVATDFEQSMSNLSAITGATGEQLKQLEEGARKIGATTSLSAQQAADAFTIIASKKPELLENNAALIATTESAILLAEAAGIELPEAADALTNSLNQFGVSADESNRFVNVLAAGAKFGAGEINYLNDAVKRFGPIASEMNISFEQSVAMMEVFAEKGIESEKAGTQFRNILVKLASGADETNPAIVGMTTALQNLGKQQLDTAELAKMFGNENLVAAQIMINSSARFVDLTQKVTGTSVAMDQARVRLDNFKGDWKSLMSITEEYMIVIGSFVSTALRPLVQGFTAFLLAMKEAPKFIKENKDLFIALGIALVTFNTAQIASTALMLKDIVVKKAHAIWTGAVTTAQNLLNAAMTANPIGFVIKAVGLLTAGFVVLYNRSQTVRAGISGIAEVALTVWEIIKETFGAITDGFKDIFAGDFSEGMKKLGQAFVKSNPITLAMTEGKRLAEAFKKGYADKIAEEMPVDAISAPNLAGTTPIDPGNLNEDNADDFSGSAMKIIRNTVDSLKAPGKEDPFKTIGSHFDKMKELHQKFGLDITSQEKARDAVRAANAKEYREKELENEEKLANAKMYLAQQLSAGLGSLIDLIGKKQGELTGFQKALAIAQIAIDTGAALAKVLPLALNTSAKDGPLAAFTLAGYIASMTASVLSGAARAKQMLSTADVPQYGGSGEKPNTGRSRPPKTAPKKSFYYGGDTGNLGIGLGDKYGDFTGFVHANEYVIPSMTVSDPYVANLLPAIEQIRQDNIRGFSSMSGKGMMGDPETKALLKQLVKITSAWPKEVRSKIVYTEFKEIEEEEEFLKSRYRA